MRSLLIEQLRLGAVPVWEGDLLYMETGHLSQEAQDKVERLRTETWRGDQSTRRLLRQIHLLRTAGLLP